MSSDWVPPLTIAPTHVTETRSQSTSNSLPSQDSMVADAATGRKKTSSVSFSIDDNSETSQSSDKTGETKKNKVCNKLNEM